MKSTHCPQVKKIVEDALDRPADKRKAFLDAQGLDPELRSVVDNFFEHADEAPHFSETVLTVSDLLYRTAEVITAHHPLELGTRVGRYVILDRLGIGGT